MAAYEIPLRQGAQFSLVALPNGNYGFRLIYNEPSAQGGPCWLLDVSDDAGNPLVCGIPLVTGTDLLGQYAYLGIGVPLYCSIDGDPLGVPDYASFGSAAHLYYVV